MVGGIIVNRYIIVLLGITSIGLIIRLCLCIAFRRLIKASEDISKTNNSLMKMICMRFETCYKLKLGVNNVGNFVDKYIYRHKVYGLYLYTWENISMQILFICMIATVSFGTYLLVNQIGQAVIIPVASTGLACFVFLFFLDNILNFNIKKEHIRVNTTDYLENNMKPRLEAQYIHPDERREYQREYFDVKTKDESVKMDSKQIEKKQPEKKNPSKIDIKMNFNSQEQKIVDEILSEYLL